MPQPASFQMLVITSRARKLPGVMNSPASTSCSENLASRISPRPQRSRCIAGFRVRSISSAGFASFTAVLRGVTVWNEKIEKKFDFDLHFGFFMPYLDVEIKN